MSNEQVRYGYFCLIKKLDEKEKRFVKNLIY